MIPAYEAFVRTTMFSSERHFDKGIAVYALGLNGEAGEVAEIIKKFLDRAKPIDREHLKLEMGDVLWYLTALSNTFGFSLKEIADANVEKLIARQAAGTHGHSQTKVGESS